MAEANQPHSAAQDRRPGGANFELYGRAITVHDTLLRCNYTINVPGSKYRGLNENAYSEQPSNPATVTVLTNIYAAIAALALVRHHTCSPAVPGSFGNGSAGVPMAMGLPFLDRWQHDRFAGDSGGEWGVVNGKLQGLLHTYHSLLGSTRPRVSSIDSEVKQLVGITIYDLTAALLSRRRFIADDSGVSAGVAALADFSRNFLEAVEFDEDTASSSCTAALRGATQKQHPLQGKVGFKFKAASYLNVTGAGTGARGRALASLARFFAGPTKVTVFFESGEVLETTSNDKRLAPAFGAREQRMGAFFANPHAQFFGDDVKLQANVKFETYGALREGVTYQVLVALGVVNPPPPNWPALPQWSRRPSQRRISSVREGAAVAPPQRRATSGITRHDTRQNLRRMGADLQRVGRGEAGLARSTLESALPAPVPAPPQRRQSTSAAAANKGEDELLRQLEHELWQRQAA